MELTLWLFFLCLHVIPCVQFSQRKWRINVPPRISAMHRSCVVIPCTYHFTALTGKSMAGRTAFWKKGQEIISTTVTRWTLPKEYKHRTNFVGDLRSRNCTMELYGVRRTDTGPFYLKIVVSQFESFSFKKNPVTIDVILNPQPPSMSVQMRDKITASCSVTHSCPVQPPKLSWSRRGIVTRRSKKLNKWQWETVSTVTFKPLMADYNKSLTCTVQHWGGKQAQKSTIIRV